MKKTRTQRAAPVATHAPPPRPDVHPREPWEPGLQSRSSWDACRPHLMSISQLTRETYYLPPWQRGQVWTPDRQVAFCRTLWDGLPFAPILLWERRVGPNINDRVSVVLDGQQRLTAVGARIVRHDGTLNTPTAAHLDLETGRWQVGPADGHPPITMARMANSQWLWRDGRRQVEGDDWWRTVSLIADADNRIRLSSTSVYVIGASMTVDDAIRVFDTWNTPGVNIPREELAELIREADRSWAPVPLPAED